MNYKEFYFLKKDIESFFEYTLGTPLIDEHVLNEISPKQKKIYDVAKLYFELKNIEEDEWDETIQIKSDELEEKAKSLLKYKKNLDDNFNKELNRFIKKNEFNTENEELTNNKIEDYEE